MSDHTKRFSNRVADYVRYRPDYPAAVFDALKSHCGWAGSVDVADLGSGTGLSALGFLARGHRVYGVEPNKEMREAAESLLADQAGFVSVDGSAEHTGLADASVDLVISAQAFHWFDVPSAATETRRILRASGHSAVLWNLRRLSGDDFLDGYEALLREYGVDYGIVAERYADPAALALYFGASGYQEYSFDHAQYFDFEGLEGRLLSSSYTPPPGHPNHLPMRDAARTLFDRTETQGQVGFLYDTKLFVSNA